MPNHDYRQHTDMREFQRKRTELVLGIASALFIATGLAGALVSWWAS